MSKTVINNTYQKSVTIALIIKYKKIYITIYNIKYKHQIYKSNINNQL